jgi:hypothetical protein
MRKLLARLRIRSENASFEGITDSVQNHLPLEPKSLRRAALKGLGQSDLRPRFPPERSNDLVILMRALADPQKIFLVYFAMTAALGKIGKVQLSESEQSEAETFSRGFGQTFLTDDEMHAIRRLARGGISDTCIRANDRNERPGLGPAGRKHFQVVCPEGDE